MPATSAYETFRVAEDVFEDWKIAEKEAITKGRWPLALPSGRNVRSGKQLKNKRKSACTATTLNA
jgi:hypothetical protein